jgi:hypothetical protein
MQQLVTEARGDSVTADQLSGSARYYPEAGYIFTGTPPLIDEQPHYIILLTTGTNIIQGTPAVSPDESGIEIKTSRGSLIVTDESLVAVGGSIGTGIFGENSRGFFQFPYDEIDSTQAIGLLDGGTISMTVNGTEYYFDLAGKHGDPENIRQAYNYIQNQI